MKMIRDQVDPSVKLAHKLMKKESERGNEVSQNGQSFSRCGRSLSAHASGFDSHRDSIARRFGRRGA